MSTSRASDCDGKIVFKKLRFAQAAAGRREGTRHIYRCNHCFLWHVGTPKPREKKFIKRQKLVRLMLEPEWEF